MSAIPYSEANLAESAAEFAEKITPAKQRWEYCFARATYAWQHPRYGSSLSVNGRTVPVVARVAGVNETRIRVNFQRLKRHDYETAHAEANARASDILGDRFAVGPMQAWHIGHLYFARVDSHPHVVKIGFSRRVHDRFEDIASKCKTKLSMRPGEIRVGTLADEHWWHKNWSDHRISGEWFFDPHMPDRTLPNFLADHAQAEAA